MKFIRIKPLIISSSFLVLGYLHSLRFFKMDSLYSIFILAESPQNLSSVAFFWFLKLNGFHSLLIISFIFHFRTAKINKLFRASPFAMFLVQILRSYWLILLALSLFARSLYCYSVYAFTAYLIFDFFTLLAF